MVLACGWAVMPVANADEVDDLNARVSKIERTLDRQGLVELVNEMDALRAELRALRGQLENQIFLLEQQRNAQRQQYVDLDRRLQGLEGRTRTPGPAQIVEQGTTTTIAPTLDPPLSTLPGTDGGTIAGTPSAQAIAVENTPAVIIGNEPPSADPAAVSESAGTNNTPDVVGVEPINAGGPMVPPTNLTPGDGTSLAGTPAASAAADPAPVVQPPANAITASSPTIDTPESEAAYRAAFSLLKAGQYDESIVGFSTFLQGYPQSQYADNAQYWIGEAYYVMRQFEPAIEQYQQLLTKFPGSKKQSHAMLKVGYSYYELGLREQARGVLNDLKQKFPSSAAARLADERLERIQQDGF